MKKILFLFLIVLCKNVCAATLLYNENFDDGDFDTPVFGTIEISTRTMDGCSTPPNCVASTPDHYIMSRTGYGDAGYCFSNPTIPADNASKDPYIRIYPSSWEHDGFYVSFRLRIVGDPNTDTYQNLKLIYPHWEGTDAYVMYNTTDVTGATSSLYYSARNNDGDYVESGTYITTDNLSDGNWHKISIWVKFSTAETWLWVDTESETLLNYTDYNNYDDSSWVGANLYYLSVTLADEGDNTGQWEYKEIDDILIYDEFPVQSSSITAAGLTFSGCELK